MIDADRKLNPCMLYRLKSVTSSLEHNHVALNLAFPQTLQHLLLASVYGS